MILRGARRIPSLNRKYRGVPDDPREPLVLVDLPVLTPLELSAATDELLRGSRPDDGSVVYASGGTPENPRLSLLPEDMFVKEVRTAWHALGHGDLLANFFSPGRQWPVHAFYNRLASRSGATALSVGDLPESQFGRDLALCARYGVNAVAAPPGVVGRLLRHRAAGHQLPWLRKLLIGGAFHDRTPAAELAALLPGVQVWQLYGSAEAWMVGHRGPGCPEGVFHTLPHQHAEIDGGRILVTTTGVRRAPALIRYLIGDRGEPAGCACGRSGRALRVLDRIAPSVVLQGSAVRAGELVDLALATGDVTAAQVAMVGTPGGEDRLELRVRLADDVPDDQYTREWIRHQVLERHLALDATGSEYSDDFQVVPVERLERRGPGEPPVLVREAAG
ncbi:hypothetical protein [Streptomyces avicenniae]|uniref:hypothetical protein n=1 Tax=Streptomyces avicenniae TaxID=500153 RepID=UPI000AC2BB3B|nr:hypothetical protein [Streptomyces avicenniae]